MPYFLLRMNPPRPTFPFDITPEEQEAMGRHGAYWRERADAGEAIAVGPVFDPAGAWGMALVEAADVDAAQALADADPISSSGLGFSWSPAPVPSLILRAEAAHNGRTGQDTDK